MSQSMTGIPAGHPQDADRIRPQQHGVAFLTRDIPQDIEAGLRRAGLSTAAFDPAEIRAALAEGMACAILWADPATALAEAFAQGHDPAAAVTAWQDGAREVLSLFRRHRRQLTLIEAGVLTSAAGAVEQGFLRERLALPNLLLPLPSQPEPSAAPEGDAWPRLLATALVPQIADIQDSLTELRGSGVFLPPSGFPLTAVAAMASDLHRLGAERDALITAREAAQQAHAQAAAEHAEEARLLRAELLRQQDRAAAAEGRQQALEAESRKAAQEGERSLARAQTEAAGLRRDLAAKETELAKAIEAGQARDKAVLAAAAELAAERDAALQAQALMRDQIALQQAELDRVQAELAKAAEAGQARDKAVLAAAAELAAERDAALQERGSLRDQIALQQREFDRVVVELRAQAEARRVVERQRDKILKSSSWRITRPMRGIKTLIAGGNKSVEDEIAEHRLRLPGP